MTEDEVDGVNTDPRAVVPPIDLAAGAASSTSRRSGPRVEIDDALLGALRSVCQTVTVDPGETAEASRDWWPLAMSWATKGEVPSRAAAVARPGSSDEISAILTLCGKHGIPVTTAGGRSGVLGGSVPVFGGVVLDMRAIAGINDVDDTSLVVDVAAGTFGDTFEDQLRSDYRLTCGHWPQSMSLSTVGGWLACRGAGQLSTRYGKIEDIVVGLDVVLADGRSISTGGHPRAAVGPDLTQLFVGSEGTLGVITGARLKVHPLPEHEFRYACSFDSFDNGLDWCRRILRRGGTPAVLRLYDEIESERHYHLGDGRSVAVVLDEGDEAVMGATAAIVNGEAEQLSATRLGDDLIDEWLMERNNVAALEALISKGLVVDTMEVSGTWTQLPNLNRTVLEAIRAVPGVLAASAHCSHSYLDGGCLYFTFAAQPGELDYDSLYKQIWDVGTRQVLTAGGALSHHHGIGLSRARFVKDALGGGFDVMTAIKASLDPLGILNPGKLGFESNFGDIGLI